MVIGAISDLLRHEGEGDKNKRTEERDAWKTYASKAAAFTLRRIADGLPAAIGLNSAKSTFLSFSLIRNFSVKEEGFNFYVQYIYRYLGGFL